MAKVRKPTPDTIVITTTDAERQEARQALVYEKALKLVRELARVGYSIVRDYPEEYVDQAREIEKEAQAAWPRT